MGRNFLTQLVLPAGTASAAPLTMQSGINLTTATSGAWEYDGKAIYSTPDGRGVSPSVMFYRLDTALAGANVNTAQLIYGAGITLQAGTVYAFEQRFAVTKSVGSTSHNLSILYGGTATINNILITGISQTATNTSPSQLASGPNSFVNNAASSFAIVGAQSTASRLTYAFLSGTVSINAGGTFIPQYILSAAPGGAYTTAAGSYFAIWPIGAAGANTSVGPWA